MRACVCNNCVDVRGTVCCVSHAYSEWHACVSCQQRRPPAGMLADTFTGPELRALAHPDLKWTLQPVPEANLKHYQLYDPAAPGLEELVLSPFGRVQTRTPDHPVLRYRMCRRCHTYLHNRRRHGDARQPKPPPDSLANGRATGLPSEVFEHVQDLTSVGTWHHP